MTTVQPTTTRPAARPAPSATSVSEPDPTRSLLAQAETIRDSLSRALSDTRDLITCIKRNQKHNRLVETTLRSLKQLEHMGAYLTESELQPHSSKCWLNKTEKIPMYFRHKWR